MPTAHAAVPRKYCMRQPRPIKRIKLIVMEIVRFLLLHAKSLSQWKPWSLAKHLESARIYQFNLGLKLWIMLLVISRQN